MLAELKGLLVRLLGNLAHKCAAVQDEVTHLLGTDNERPHDEHCSRYANLEASRSFCASARWTSIIHVCLCACVLALVLCQWPEAPCARAVVREWALWAIRNLCDNNDDNQALIAGLEMKGTALPWGACTRAL